MLYNNSNEEIIKMSTHRSQNRCLLKGWMCNLMAESLSCMGRGWKWYWSKWLQWWRREWIAWKKSALLNLNIEVGDKTSLEVFISAGTSLKKLSLFSYFSASGFSAAIAAEKWLYGCDRFSLLHLHSVTTFHRILCSPSPHHSWLASKQFALMRVPLMEISLNSFVALQWNHVFQTSA